MKDVSTELISSRSNKAVKYLKSLSLARNRQKERRFLIEGVRLVEEAIERKGCVEKLIITPQAMPNERVGSLIETAEAHGTEIMWAADRVMDYISETKTNQGVMALVHPSEFTEADLEGGLVPLVVVAHMLQDPGNLGVIVRIAEAAGAAGVVATPGTVDFYNPKAVRATMGSIFRLPTVKTDSLEGFVGRFKEKGYQIAAAMVSAKKRHFELDFLKPTVVLFGQEAAGLPPEAYNLSDVQISVPMVTMIDSLHVGCAAGVILYEAVRQKYLKNGGAGLK